MSYSNQYLAAWIVAALAAAVGVMQTTGVVTLGLPAIVGPWLGVLIAVLAIAQLALPKVVGPGTLTPAEYAQAVAAKEAQAAAAAQTATPTSSSGA